jgi:hypothetical protein
MSFSYQPGMPPPRGVFAFPPGVPGPRSDRTWCAATPFYLRAAAGLVRRSFGMRVRPVVLWAYRHAYRRGYYHPVDSCPGHSGMVCDPTARARVLDRPWPD